MIPTMGIRDRLIVNKLTYLYSTPKRGDIIVFEFRWMMDVNL